MAGIVARYIGDVNAAIAGTDEHHADFRYAGDAPNSPQRLLRVITELGYDPQAYGDVFNAQRVHTAIGLNEAAVGPHPQIGIDARLHTTSRVFAALELGATDAERTGVVAERQEYLDAVNSSTRVSNYTVGFLSYAAAGTAAVPVTGPLGPVAGVFAGALAATATGIAGTDIADQIIHNSHVDPTLEASREASEADQRRAHQRRCDHRAAH